MSVSWLCEESSAIYIMWCVTWPVTLVFSINFNMSIDLLNQELDKIQNFTAHIDIEKAIKLSQMTMKCYYNNKHQSKFFNIDDNVMLQFHKDYSILIIINKKLAQQYTSLFKVLEQIRKLVYRLKLSSHWKIHSVISIAHLESYRADVFNCSWSSHPDTVYMKEDTDEYRSYIIKKLINKSVQIICRKLQIKYLVC